MEEIISEINKHGFFPNEVVPDGEIRRFKRTPQDKHLDAWYAAYENYTSTGEKFYFYIGGDWREPGRFINVSSRNKLSVIDKQIINDQVEQTKFQIELEKEKLKFQCESECTQIWSKAQDFKDTDYTLKKQIKGDFKVKTKSSPSGDVVLVPVKNIDDKLVGLQKIHPSGKKFFHPGTSKKGSFHLIGEHINGEAYICEGFATGASIHMATGKPVIIAFDAGNLLPVAKEIRKKYKTTKLIICGDDDKWTENNPGKTFAKKAAEAVKGSVIFPAFSKEVEGLTDFNDLHTSEGLAKVQENLNTSKDVIETKPIRVSETQIVDNLLDLFNGHIVQQEGDMFSYLNGVWKQLKNGDINSLKAKILKLYGPTAKSKDAESTFKSFKYRIPESPVEMYKPNPYCVNFLNGTLHISKNSDQSWKKDFLPHNPQDFLINQMNFDYSDDYSEKNNEFLSMLDRVFANDEDRVEKILALKQMYGACLIPAFPHLFMLHGQAGTGKTSVILPLYEFLRECNISSVEPYQFQGFAMEEMAGKLVNIVTDIDTKKPIEDANIKKIEDRIPVRIDRKFKSAIYAPLPAIHIFGGNDIPPTLDGSSRAHSRRWTFIEFKSFQATGFYDKSFASWVFNKSPRGILNFALEGLDELLMSRGHFLNPSSGKARIDEWMVEGDIVQQFLNDIGTLEVDVSDKIKLIFDARERVTRNQIFEAFTKWYDYSGQDKYKKRCTRNNLYDALRKKKFVFLDSHGQRFILGFSFKGTV